MLSCEIFVKDPRIEALVLSKGGHLQGVLMVEEDRTPRTETINRKFGLFSQIYILSGLLVSDTF